jgi:hypothetical protein
VPCRSAERIAFGYLVSQKFTGERATLEVLLQIFNLLCIPFVAPAMS